MVKRTRADAAADDHPSLSHRFGGALLRGFVWVIAFGSTQLRRLSLTCALIAVVGFLAIAGLIRYLERRSFQIFIVYRVALGVLVLALGWGMRHHLG